MEILVTGATGFIGKYILKELARSNPGSQIVTLSRSQSNYSSYRHIQADLLNPNLASKFRGVNPDTVIHLAGQLSSCNNKMEYSTLMAQNVMATYNLLNTLGRKKPLHFIYICSSAIYSTQSRRSILESEIALPSSIYGLTKLHAEDLVRFICESRNFFWSSVILSNCYGPIEDMTRGVIKQFYNRLIIGLAPIIRHPNIYRDFLHVSDAATAITRLIMRPTNSRINISSNVSTNLIELSKIMQRKMEVDISPKILDSNEDILDFSQLDNSLAMEKLQWTPEVNLKNGIVNVLGK
jgi:UDP-glucose 4-epimerase